MNNIIIGTNIRKTFGVNEEKTIALNGVNIQIASGEFVAIMGSSGSGKSTLLFALSGIDTVEEGSISFNGIDLGSLDDKGLADIRRTKMGFVFQQATMLKNLNLLDNIILPVLQGNKKEVKIIIQKAKELMKKTGIAGLEYRSITEVSGGQLQRAGICRALMNNPHVLFADEPTGALNSKATDEIMNLLTDINSEGTAILLVTHNAKVAASADKVLFMKDGNIVNTLSFDKYNREPIEARTERIIMNMAKIEI